MEIPLYVNRYKNIFHYKLLGTGFKVQRSKVAADERCPPH